MVSGTRLAVSVLRERKSLTPDLSGASTTDELAVAVIDAMEK